MHTTRFGGPLLVFALSHLAYAQDDNTPEPSQPTPQGPAREPALESRLIALESKLETLSLKVAQPQPEESAEVAPVDPDLSRAASQDATRPTVIPVSKMNPDMSVILDVGGAWFKKRDHLQQGGHAINDNGLQLQGLELAASASVDPYFRFDSYFQLTEAEVEEAYLTTTSLPWNLQLRAGLMNATFGRENSLHLHAWNFANPPLSHTRFMSEEHFRGPGVELSALMPLPWYLNLIGQVLGTSEELGFNSSSFGASEVNRHQRIEGLEDLQYIMRMENFLELSPDWSLLVGLSEGLGQSPFEPDGRSYLHGCDLYLKWRPVSSGRGDFALALTIEYVLRDTALENGRLRDHGGYAELDAQLTQRWMTGLRFDTTSLWHDQTPNPEDVGGWQRRGSLSLTFLPTHFSKLRLQGDMLRERDRNGLQHAVFVQAEVSAGEHGAHKF